MKLTANDQTSAPAGGPANAALTQERAILMAALIGVSAVAWLYTIYRGWSVNGMETAMPRMEPWSGADFVLAFVMWVVMMMAMMIPSASPMILMFAAINRKRRERQDPFVPTGLFLLSYLLVWGGFSALAATAQWRLSAAELFSPAMAITSSLLGGGLLLAAGIYQMMPLKYACLHHCRSPLEHLINGWREGRPGAFVMGLRHGVYCMGCCWALMSLLFVGGVMNLLWVAIIAAIVFAEKVAPAGRWVSRISGTLLMAWGIWMLTLWW